MSDPSFERGLRRIRMGDAIDRLRELARWLAAQPTHEYPPDVTRDLLAVADACKTADETICDALDADSEINGACPVDGAPKIAGFAGSVTPAS